VALGASIPHVVLDAPNHALVEPKARTRLFRTDQRPKFHTLLHLCDMETLQAIPSDVPSTAIASPHDVVRAACMSCKPYLSWQTGAAVASLVAQGDDATVHVARQSPSSDASLTRRARSAPARLCADRSTKRAAIGQTPICRIR
jgi:hypothetical protein